MEIYADAARLLGDKELCKLSENVTLHQQYQLEDLADANHWELAEALHITLANGLAFLEAVKIGRTSLSDRTEGEESAEALLSLVAEQWQEPAIRFDTRYATLKFMAFRLMQNNQTLQFNLSGLKNGLGMARGTTPYLQKERQRLEQLNQLLRQEHCVITPAERAIPLLAPAFPAPLKLSQHYDPNQTNPKITYFHGGAACYELVVIDELYEAAEMSQQVTGEHKLGAFVLELGLSVLKAITNSQNGDLPLSLLERAGQKIGWQAFVKNSPKEVVEQARKALDHFLSARSMTLVMEARVAFLKAGGEQLEEEVQGLREQDWAWHEWSNSMRTYLARLELENRRIKEPEYSEESQPNTPKFSVIKWFLERIR